MTRNQITLCAINLEAQDPARLAEFWASVTGSSPAPGGDGVYLPPAGPGGFGMFFQPMTEPRSERQTIHLDLTVPWGARQAEVDRLVSLGATYQWDVLDEAPHTCSGPPWPIWKESRFALPDIRLQTSRQHDHSRRTVNAGSA